MAKFKLALSGVSIAAALLIFGVSASANEPKPGEPSASKLISMLKKGGYVVYIRHGSTEKDYADQIKAVPNDCSTQRVLSEKGWKEAKRIGKAFRDYSIPVESVTSSQYCRAWKTADLAFNKYVKNADLNFEPAEEYSDAQVKTMRDNTVPFISMMPKNKSKNIVIVGHDDPFESATGIYPEPQGVTFILKPMGKGKFKIIGNINPTAWPKSM